MAIQIITGKPGEGMRFNQLNLSTWALDAEFSGLPFDVESARLDPYYNAAVYEEYLQLPVIESQPGQPAQLKPCEE